MHQAALADDIPITLPNVSRHGLSEWQITDGMFVFSGVIALQTIRPKLRSDLYIVNTRWSRTSITVAKIVLKFAGHGSNSSVLCAKFENDFISEQ